MERETTRKVGSIVLGLMVVGLVGLAPASAAETVTSPSETTADPCITINTSGPGVRVDPESCKRIVLENVTAPPADL